MKKVTASEYKKPLNTGQFYSNSGTWESDHVNAGPLNLSNTYRLDCMLWAGQGK